MKRNIYVRKKMKNKTNIIFKNYQIWCKESYVFIKIMLKIWIIDININKYTCKYIIRRYFRLFPRKIELNNFGF